MLTKLLESMLSSLLRTPSLHTLMYLEPDQLATLCFYPEWGLLYEEW